MTLINILNKIENNEYSQEQKTLLSTIIDKNEGINWNRDKVKAMNKEVSENNKPGLLQFQQDCKNFLNDEHSNLEADKVEKLIERLCFGHNFKSRVMTLLDGVSRINEGINRENGKLVLSESKSITLKLNTKTIEEMYNIRSKSTFEPYTGKNMETRLDTIKKGNEEITLNQFTKELLEMIGVEMYKDAKSIINFSTYWEDSEDGYSGHDLLRTNLSSIEIIYKTV